MADIVCPQFHRPLSLVLFFTRSMSLRHWKEYGLLSREVALYRRLQDKGVHISFVTYGKKDDLQFARDLPGITICCNRWGLPQRLYEQLLPRLHRNVLREADLCKTNQTNGAEIALRCAQFWKKPMIARCGYLWSEFSRRQNGEGSAEAKWSEEAERQVFTMSRRIVVTTEEMRTNVTKRCPGFAEKTLVIPNYVDTDLFSPKSSCRDAGRICYIGRLDQEQKNLRTLLQAVRDMNVDLDIIGDGPLREEVAAETRSNPRIHLLGKIPHEHLPELLHKAAAYVLPSYYEGHPKTLIEAMACGTPVIAADAPGINTVVRHGETGWLCDTSPKSIRQAIQAVLADSDLQRKLGEGAREYARSHYSLDMVVEKELEMYSNIIEEIRRDD